MWLYWDARCQLKWKRWGKIYINIQYCGCSMKIIYFVSSMFSDKLKLTILVQGLRKFTYVLGEKQQPSKNPFHSWKINCLEAKNKADSEREIHGFHLPYTVYRHRYCSVVPSVFIRGSHCSIRHITTAAINGKSLEQHFCIFSKTIIKQS